MPGLFVPEVVGEKKGGLVNLAFLQSIKPPLRYVLSQRKVDLVDYHWLAHEWTHDTANTGQ
jgi:hypothetical protein